MGATKVGCLILLLSALHGKASTQKLDSRSYQLSPIPIINGVQGVQYVPMVYSEIPTVLVPKQIGMDVMALHSTPTASAVLPPQGMLHHKYYETSTPLYHSATVQESVLQPVKTYERQSPAYRPKKIPVYAVKRPAYHNHLSRKKLGGHFQNQKVSSISIEPSIDLTDQLQQLQSTYPSTTPAPVSTYGPAKALDHHSGMPHVTTYLRPKGHHPHPHYHPKDYRVYSHYHKGHVHNHHIPPGYSLHKSQYHSSAKPVYPSILKPTPTYIPVEDPSEYKQEKEPSFNYHAYARPETFSTNHIRFPDGELKKSLLNAYKTHQEEILGSGRFPYRQSLPSKGHSELTQAIVKDSGTINNYDASIPVRIPSKKPNKFEVKEILRNADVHFIDGTASEPDYDRGQQPSIPLSPASHYDQGQYIQMYQPSQLFDPSKTSYRVLSSTDEGGYASQGLIHNHIDYYDQRDAASYIHHQHSTGRDELSTSETIKVPVAVIKGTHAVTAQGAYPINGQRVADSTKTKAFTPSSTSSDWIPMSGQVTSSDSSVQASVGSSTTLLDTRYGDKYFADLLKSRTESADEPTRIITSNRNIGDIISGKIPSEYSPFKSLTGHGSRMSSSSSSGDIITGKIPFADDSEIDRRKGSVLDDNPTSSDTSNLVVSSMIKFS